VTNTFCPSTSGLEMDVVGSVVAAQNLLLKAFTYCDYNKVGQISDVVQPIECITKLTMPRINRIILVGIRDNTIQTAIRKPKMTEDLKGSCKTSQPVIESINTFSSQI
jgi:hypothetical protein